MGGIEYHDSDGEGMRQIIRDITAAKLGRWEGLRRLPSPNNELLFPLPNDSTLAQQAVGLIKWCEHFAPQQSFSPEDARLVALAYVARQIECISRSENTATCTIGGQNTLLNSQTLATRTADSARLDQHVVLLSALEEHAAAKIFRNVARSLEENSDDGNYAELLKLANAAFYIGTGVEALLWYRDHGAAWCERDARSRVSAEILQHRVLLLSANAYGNNHQKLDTLQNRQVLEEILAPLTAAELAALKSNRNYQESLKVSKTAPASVAIPVARVVIDGPSRPKQDQGPADLFPKNER